MEIKIACFLIVMICVGMTLYVAKNKIIEGKLVQSVSCMILSLAMFIFWDIDCLGDMLASRFVDMGDIKLCLCGVLFLTSGVNAVIYIIKQKKL